METPNVLKDAEWVRLAGLYIAASDAMRAADYNPRVTDAQYATLVCARERAFQALDRRAIEVRGTRG
jgi:hypothetical protein